MFELEQGRVPLESNKLMLGLSFFTYFWSDFVCSATGANWHLDGSISCSQGR